MQPRARLWPPGLWQHLATPSRHPSSPSPGPWLRAGSCAHQGLGRHIPRRSHECVLLVRFTFATFDPPTHPLPPPPQPPAPTHAVRPRPERPVRHVPCAFVCLSRKHAHGLFVCARGRPGVRVVAGQSGDFCHSLHGLLAPPRPPGRPPLAGKRRPFLTRGVGGLRGPARQYRGSGMNL